MLTSFLSLYIAANLNQNLNQDSSHQFASISLSNILENSEAPIKDPQYISPILEAKGIIAMDLKTGEILHGKNVHERMPIASITKLMTMLIVLEENMIDETTIISNNAASTEGSTMYLVSGEKITVQSLILGAIINSANDAAVALAEHNAINVDRFVEKMNNRATELGLVNTHFQNPIGLDHPDNYSSPYDVAKLAQYIYHNNFIKEAAKIKNLSVKSIDGVYVHRLESTNELIDSYLRVKGLKTGSTTAAGLCLATVAENEEGKEIITVVLNSPARFKETTILIDWAFRAYKWY